MPGSGSPRNEELIDGLVAFAATQNELTRLFARSRGMHTTDAAAVVEIIDAEDRGQPLTPARLAERIGLSAGATSILLSRLEKSGAIERRHDHTDRRKVTLNSTAAINATADDFFEPLQRRLAEALDDFTAEDLDTVLTVIGALRTVTRDYLEDRVTGPASGPRRPAR